MGDLRLELADNSQFLPRLDLSLPPGRSAVINCHCDAMRREMKAVIAGDKKVTRFTFTLGALQLHALSLAARIRHGLFFFENTEIVLDGIRVSEYLKLYLDNVLAAPPSSRQFRAEVNFALEGAGIGQSFMNESLTAAAMHRLMQPLQLLQLQLVKPRLIVIDELYQELTAKIAALLPDAILLGLNQISPLVINDDDGFGKEGL